MFSQTGQFEHHHERDDCLSRPEKRFVDIVRRDAKGGGCAGRESTHLLPVCFSQHHELTGDKRERETGSWVCPAGKLQLRQRSLSRVTGTNQEVCVHFTGQQFSAKMAAGTYFLLALHLNSWASFLKFMRFSAVARNKWGERSCPGHHVHSGELPAGGGACNTQ